MLKIIKGRTVSELEIVRQAAEEVADLLFEYQDKRFTDEALSKFFIELEQRLRRALDRTKGGK